MAVHVQLGGPAGPHRVDTQLGRDLGRATAFADEVVQVVAVLVVEALRWSGKAQTPQSAQLDRQGLTRRRIPDIRRRAIVIAIVGPKIAAMGSDISSADYGIGQHLLFDPQIPGTVYAGIRGAGVLKTSDGGDTWTAMNDGLTNLTVSSLAVDPQTPTRLYAGTIGGGVFAITITRRFDLAVASAGDGRGTVTSSPDGIACGTECTAPYAEGTTVTLIATAADDSVFTGWSGCDASEDTTCTVTMTGDREVTATFVGVP